MNGYTESELYPAAGQMYLHADCMQYILYFEDLFDKITILLDVSRFVKSRCKLNQCNYKPFMT